MPTETVAFAYDGATTATATISNATPGTNYKLDCFDPDSSSDTATAVGTTLVLTVSTIGGVSVGDTFDAQVTNEDAVVLVGMTLFAFGTTGEYSFTAVWHFDGADTVTVTFDSDISVTYLLSITDSTGTTSGSGVPGTGASLLMTRTAASPPVDDYFYASLDHFGGLPFSVRLFSAGISGAGVAGNPGGGDPTAPDAPTLDSATPGAGTVTLSWAPAFNGGSAITAAKIYRGSASGGETLLATLGAVTSYVDHAPPGTWFYKVTEVNVIGESPLSNELSAAPDTFTWTNEGPQITVEVAAGLNPGSFTVARTLGLGEARASFDPLVVESQQTQAFNVRLVQHGPSAITEIYSVDIDLRPLPSSLLGETA